MTREQLAEYCQREARRQTRRILLTLCFLLLWILGTGFLGDRLDWIGHAARSTVIFSSGFALALLIFVAIVSDAVRKLPKCPHCGMRMYRHLLPTAIATGNCGNCGKSIES